MADELTPAVIDVPLGLMDQQPPPHGGPLGRIQTLLDGEVVHYLPPQPGGAGGGASPQTIAVQQRRGFASLSSEIQDVATGIVQGGAAFPRGELLSTLGDQLVSVANSVPKVFNGTNWAQYGGARVLAGKLSQDILHTSSRTIQACDSATIGNTTCFVWTETSGGGLTTSFVGFRAADGAWIVTPQTLVAMTITIDHALAKVVSDGTFFWVFYNLANASPNITVKLFDTKGSLINTTTKARHWLTSPGYWDVVAAPAGGVILAQPNTYNPGAESHVDLTRFTTSGGIITQSSNADASLSSIGQMAWLTNQAGLSNFSYLATLAPGSEGFWNLKVYEINTGTLTRAKTFNVITVPAPPANAGPIDALAGWIVSGSDGIDVRVAVSYQSDWLPPAGPPNDPALRKVDVWSCDRSDVSALLTRKNGVCLQSRAFQPPRTPAASPDFYAVTYYQSGGGRLPAQNAISIAHTAGDFMVGAAEQPLNVSVGDGVTGAPHVVGSLNGHLLPTDTIASITHNAGDSATASTRQWKFLNANFTGAAPTGGPPFTCQYGLLTITGSGIANNNQTYRIIKVISSTIVETEAVGSAGHAMADDTLAGVTASVQSQFLFISPRSLNGDILPAAMIGQYAPNGSLTVAGSNWPANNNTFTIKKIYTGATQLDVLGTSTDVFNIVVVTPIGALLEDVGTPWTITLAPVFGETWIFSGETFDTSVDGGTLSVSGAKNAANNGDFVINTHLTNALQTSAATMLLPEVFAEPLPSLSLTISESASLQITLQAFTFNDSHTGAFLVIGGAAHAANNTTYQIDHVLGAHVVKVHVVLNVGVVRSEVFGGGVTASLLLATDPSPAFQPCWFLTPLSVSQQIAGKFEYGVAYADWRLDGATLSSTSPGADFARNNFPMALASVSLAQDGTARFALPYRAQSFTAGQVVRSDATTIGIEDVQQSTVGLKLFTLSGATFGQAFQASGELLLPGPLGATFTDSGFAEDQVSLAFEVPFFISQATDATVIGLTTKGTYQYVVVGEVTDERGDRSFTVPSPPLQVTLTGTNNKITFGGRMIGPTNRTLVSIAIYRTAMVNGVPTVQHYKITNDLDVNGAGFTFSNLSSGSGTPDTWQFVDTVPDTGLPAGELLYTDKALTPRFAAPAGSQGVFWCNRPWVVGYDGAVWMGAEKTEGDAVWFTPIFRFVLPTEDKPVALASLDEYLLVFCSRSVWYIPKTDFPSATLQSGSLPTPVQLPFQNGCTGWALTVRAGVAYASSAGGMWVITRDLRNVWLSQPLVDELSGAAITSMAVDDKQRLCVAVGSARLYVFDQVAGCWLIWRIPAAAVLVTSWQGLLTYQDTQATSNVVVYNPNATFDAIGGLGTAIALDIQLASINFAGVRSFKRCWAIQIVGQHRDAHRLNVVVSYPDDDMADTTYPPFVPDPSLAYVYEVNPDPEEATTFNVRLFVDYNDPGILSPGDSFVLELLSFEVGLESGIGRLPSTKRISSG